VSGLAAVLIGLAALLGERGARSASRAGVRERLQERGGATSGREPRDPKLARSVAAPLASGLAGSVLLGPVWGVVAALAVIGVRLGRKRRRRARDRARRDEQLADAVGAIVSALRAGMSVPQSLAYAAGEAELPVADDLGCVVRDVDLGVPIHEALARWGDRAESPDARLIVGALELHRRTGGDLPAVLEQVGTTVRDRVAASREVRALTAQARLSGTILGLLPIGFFGFLWLTSRSEIQGALATPAGLASIVLGLVLDGLAFLWIRSLLEVT
jgi:tight adherence protein B